ncbi:ABC transporter permease [Lachnoclostridium phytofermentans]|uniref:Binding-protein-dependent transport systems inner membrane component n=1 Tax=Lachnoclostridium phytofermentans (strain ATCC 700394 / DSM 18823 / ISDg) TaxID=357809 RepID=A9KRV2_LACP7|nr:ABC transporter permease subunit [Lachnoclostridium phytofermentans]ABX43596.1 binding-protein-dependent transport systems inner membrane component [Lachnoclostridium phytofermentans ISDg]
MTFKGKKSTTINLKKRPFRKDWTLYLLFLPAFIYILLFKLFPLPGIAIAFKDFNIFEGFFASEWVGLDHFKALFTQPRFLKVLSNTLEISFLKILILFPLPIILAIMLNEMRNRHYKKTVQTLIYLPHFLSFVIIHGLFTNFLSTQGGMVNELLQAIGIGPINFYSNSWFRFVILLTEGFKEVGWGTIVYLAALAGVDPQLYEAAEVDGAGKLRQMISITLPSIIPIIALMLTLRVGNILDAGTEQILVMYNSSVYDTADIIGTLVYREGIGNAQYGFATAVGLFNSIASFILIMTANTFSSKVFKRGLW